MNGCVYLKCRNYWDSECHSTFDYVDRETGKDMCYRNPNAVLSIQFEEEHELRQLRAELAAARKVVKNNMEEITFNRRVFTPSSSPSYRSSLIADDGWCPPAIIYDKRLYKTALEFCFGANAEVISLPEIVGRDYSAPPESTEVAVWSVFRSSKDNPTIVKAKGQTQEFAPGWWRVELV